MRKSGAVWRNAAFRYAKFCQKGPLRLITAPLGPIPVPPAKNGTLLEPQLRILGSGTAPEDKLESSCIVHRTQYVMQLY